jgi:MFS transporter, SP family, sugar:H+ symporter
MTRGTIPAPGPTPAKANRRVRVLAFSGALGGFLFGFDSSVANGAVDSVQGHFALSTTVVGFAAASPLLGCAIGAWLAGGLSNRWGRIPVMVLGAAFFPISFSIRRPGAERSSASPRPSSRSRCRTASPPCPR